ncbi:unnamed protein product [Ectocarpus sp. 8 AP-2014]
MFRRRQFHTKPTTSDSLGGAKTLRGTKEEENEEKEGRDRAVGFQFKEVGTLANRAKNPVVFLDVSIGGVPARLTFELRKDIVPRTAENFRSICAGDRADTQDGTRLSYQGCVFHRVIKDFAVIGGDIAVSDAVIGLGTPTGTHKTVAKRRKRNGCGCRHDGTGRASIYGGHFADENFVLRHTGPGVLTCCNAGPDTNSSAFMITTVEAPWLNGRSVAFGCLANAESFDALEKLEACGVEGGRPSVYIQASYTMLPEVGADDLDLLPSLPPCLPPPHRPAFRNFSNAKCS